MAKLIEITYGNNWYIFPEGIEMIDAADVYDQIIAENRGLA